MLVLNFWIMVLRP